MAKKRKSRSRKAPASTPRVAEQTSSETGRASCSRSDLDGSRESSTFTRVDLLWALGLSLLAFVHRLLFLNSNRDREWPFTLFYEGDSQAFFLFARALLEGKPYDEGLPFHPPGFAYILAQVHEFLGVGAAGATIAHLQVKALLAAFGSLAVGMLYLLVRPYLGRTVAVLTALLGVYHFGLYIIAIAPVTEGSYLTLYLAAWLLFVRGLPHPLTAPGATPRRPMLVATCLGVLCGCLALIRAEAMLLPFIFVGLGLWGLGPWGSGRARNRDGLKLSFSGRSGSSWGPWLAILVVCGLTISPWTLRNHRTLTALNEHYGDALAEPIPTFVPITIYGPLNLALANNALADGTFSRDTMSSQKLSGNLDLEDPQHLDFILHGDRHARKWILENPGAFLRLVGKKWELVSRMFTMGWTQWNWPGGLDGVRRPVDVFTPESTVLRWIFLPCVLLGMFLCFRAGPEARLWLAVVAAASVIGAVSTTVFYGYVRQGLLMLPLFLSFAGVTLTAVLDRGLSGIRNRAEPGRRLLAALAVLAALMLVLEWTGVKEDRNFEATGSTIPGSHKLNPDQPIHFKLLTPD